MSGDLTNSIAIDPRGTLLAVAVTGFIYASQAVMLAGVRPAEELINDSMIIGDIAVWPIWITAGVFAATLSSALGSMMGAPRILQAFARDDFSRWSNFSGPGAARRMNHAGATVLHS